MKSIHGSYTLSHAVSDASVAVVSSKYGAWGATRSPRGWSPCLYSLDPPPAQFRLHRLEFTWNSTGYLVPENVGHVFVCLRSPALADFDSDGQLDLVGVGMVIGNVSGYPVLGGGSGPAPYPNAATIETFGGNTNALYGESTTSPQMHDGTDYRVSISSEDTRAGERGRLVRMSVAGPTDAPFQCTLFDHRATYDGEHAAMIVGEAFGELAWTITLSDVIETVE